MADFSDVYDDYGVPISILKSNNNKSKRRKTLKETSSNVIVSGVYYHNDTQYLGNPPVYPYNYGKVMNQHII